ncbi:MAG: UvrB/UvrC motif-containing protein [Verrucomicrobiota bacterium]
MLCESCNEREATVHLTQVLDGSVKKLHLCEECAAKSGFDVQGPMSITDILMGMGSSLDAPEPGVERSCPRCHLRRSDFKKTGRLGCPDCYETFASELLPLVKAIHRSEQHAGKVPARDSVRVRTSAELEGFQKALGDAVAKENYEEAAALRDKIARLQEKPGGEGKKGAP